jgi:hypothetical protein
MGVDFPRGTLAQFKPSVRGLAPCTRRRRAVFAPPSHRGHLLLTRQARFALVGMDATALPPLRWALLRGPSDEEARGAGAAAAALGAAPGGDRAAAALVPLAVPCARLRLASAVLPRDAAVVPAMFAVAGGSEEAGAGGSSCGAVDATATEVRARVPHTFNQSNVPFAPIPSFWLPYLR